MRGIAAVGFLVKQGYGALEQLAGLFRAVANAGHAQFAELGQRSNHVKQHTGAAVGLVVDVVADDDVEQVFGQQSAVGW